MKSAPVSTLQRILPVQRLREIFVVIMRGSFVENRSPICRDMVSVDCCSSERRKVSDFGPEYGTHSEFEQVP